MKYAKTILGFASVVAFMGNADIVSAQEVTTRTNATVTPVAQIVTDSVVVTDTIVVTPTAIEGEVSILPAPDISVPAISEAGNWYNESRASVQSEREELKAERRTLFLNIKTQFKKVINVFN